MTDLPPTARFAPLSRYFPVSREHRAWGICVFNIGTGRIAPGTPYPAVRKGDKFPFNWENGRTLPFPKLLYVTRGSGVFDSQETGLLPVQAGSILFLKPGQWHRYRPDPAVGWDETWFKLDGHSVKRLLNRPEFSTPVLQVGTGDRLREYFDQLVATARTAAFGFEYILAGLAVQILAQILVECGAPEFRDDAIQRMVGRARQRLLEDVSGTTDLPALARELGVSYSTFRRAFKACTQLSPGQFQLQSKIQKAEQFLSDTELPVGEVAERLGFPSMYYFSQIYKRKTGLSPLAYRKKYSVPPPPAGTPPAQPRNSARR